MFALIAALLTPPTVTLPAEGAVQITHSYMSPGAICRMLPRRDATIHPTLKPPNAIHLQRPASAILGNPHCQTRITAEGWLTLPAGTYTITAPKEAQVSTWVITRRVTGKEVELKPDEHLLIRASDTQKIAPDCPPALDVKPDFKTNRLVAKWSHLCLPAEAARAVVSLGHFSHAGKWTVEVPGKLEALLVVKATE